MIPRYIQHDDECGSTIIWIKETDWDFISYDSINFEEDGEGFGLE